MALIKVVLVMSFSGIGLWAVNTYVPMTNTVKAIVNPLLIALVCLWLCATFGVIDSIRHLFER